MESFLSSHYNHPALCGLFYFTNEKKTASQRHCLYTVFLEETVWLFNRGLTQGASLLSWFHLRNYYLSKALSLYFFLKEILLLKDSPSFFSFIED